MEEVNRKYRDIISTLTRDDKLTQATEDYRRAKEGVGFDA
jgi:hypothetical protein